MEQNKSALPSVEALVHGILCNALVCLAIWLPFAAHSVSGKILAILCPIAAFVELAYRRPAASPA